MRGVGVCEGWIPNLRAAGVTVVFCPPEHQPSCKAAESTRRFPI